MGTVGRAGGKSGKATVVEHRTAIVARVAYNLMDAISFLRRFVAFFFF